MKVEKRCKFCGHGGARMAVANVTMFGPPAPGREEWRCLYPRACIRRMEQVGQWVGARVLRRIDIDGTEWTIRRGVYATPRADVEGRDFVLTMEYRDHRLTSWHTTPEAAKAHVEDLVASWRAKSLRDYDAEEPQTVSPEPELWSL